jgi:PilZ domain-containing protein
MSELPHGARSTPRRERRYRRFTLQHPVCVKIQSADSAIELEGVSKNISICGLLIETSRIIPRHTPVSFVMTVHGDYAARAMQFTGKGKVVRVDAQGEKAGFAIAVECARPIAHLEDYLPATGS